MDRGGGGAISVTSAPVVEMQRAVFLGEKAEVAPVALTRVAPAGSMIVNSSRGGGSKDTWLLGGAEQTSV